MTDQDSQHIAVVGIGCRFPKAPSLDAFWQRIEQGKVAFSEIPKNRWNHSAFYSSSQRDVDVSWTASGSFIDEFEEFAAMHYGIAPRRLEVMDPQQRLLIECTRVALQDAGYEQGGFRRDRTGVYVGVSISEFQSLTAGRLNAIRLAAGDFGSAPADAATRERLLQLAAHTAPMRAFTLPGSLTALASASIAQTFDLGGPAYTIDSACASASVAIHDAMLQLRAGLIDQALAGGAYINLAPDNLVAFTKIGAISPSGVCRPFDARADGFVQSDGVGMVMLKRLGDALRDDDRIYAVIRGSGCNNDGRGEGPMTPRAQGQLRALQAAYEDADISPASVAYFEAHGTATSIGDPVEVQALGEILAEAGMTTDKPAWLGSVKGNIGHAMSAAGIAGFLKAIKVLERRTVPVQPGFQSPNPKIDLDRHPLQVPTKTQRLDPRPGSPMRVAVSSFGFGGTNSHLVLEEPPARPRALSVSRPFAVDLSLEPDGVVLPEAVVVTAPTEALLAKHCAELADYLESGPGQERSLADVAFTLNTRRRQEKVRASIGAKSAKDLIENLRFVQSALLEEDTALPLRLGRVAEVYEVGEDEPKVAFLFPGQGAQRVGLMSDIHERFSSFRRHFARLDQSTQDILPKKISEYLWTEPTEQAETALRATQVCQPAMAALGLSLGLTLEDFGVRADVSLGHSLGEFAALGHAKSMMAERAVRLVAQRGQAMSNLQLKDTGAMAAVMGSAEGVRKHITNIEGVWLANINQPKQVSISGTTAGVEAATERLSSAGYTVQALAVSHAFHSPLMAPVAQQVAELLGGYQISAPTHVVASCIADRPHADNGQGVKEILVEHATAPVNFVRGLEQAHAAGATVFVQVGAGSMLTGFARSTLGPDVSVVNLASTKADAGYSLLRGLTLLAAQGIPVDFAAVYDEDERRPVTLPETPLERQRYSPFKKSPQPVSNIAGLHLDDDLPRVAPPAGSAGPELETLVRRQTQLLAEAVQVSQAQFGLLGIEPEPGIDLQDKLRSILNETPATARKAEPKTEPKKADGPKAEPVAAEQDVGVGVRKVVAKVSAFPVSHVKNEQRLVDELGFDSLMVADLGGALEAAFPGLGALPPSLFKLETTTGDLVAYVEQTMKAGPTEPVVDVDAPLELYIPRTYPEAATTHHGHNPTDEIWVVTHGGSPLAGEIVKTLEARGAQSLGIRFIDNEFEAEDTGAFRDNAWTVDRADEIWSTVPSDQIAGWIHIANSDGDPLEAFHRAAQKAPDVHIGVVTAMGGAHALEPSADLTKNLAQSKLTGYIKALARERADRTIRALDLRSDAVPAEAAEWVVQEVLAPHQQIEVAFGGRRCVSKLEHFAPQKRVIAWSQEVVLITGGLGDLGKIVAERLAKRRVKGLIVMGRRSITKVQDELQALRAAGAPVWYVEHALGSGEPLSTKMSAALKELGPVTTIIHSAGVIDDGNSRDLGWSQIQAVMAPKVDGFREVMAACPRAKNVVNMASWAGRFGNANQTGYAAANAWLDASAMAHQDGPRVVSIDWPPWKGSRMVASIPEAVQRSLEASGVTFVAPDEGLDMFERVFASSLSGVCVVGRALPKREVGAELEESASLKSMPYLADHQLKGRPVMPLAAALDAVAWTATATGQVQLPMTVSDLTLTRGVFAEDSLRLKASGRESEDATKLDVTILAGHQGNESVAYRAKVEAGVAGFEVPSISVEDKAASISREAFYNDHTFHGPQFHGIRSIDRRSTDGITGQVGTSEVSAWWPASGRGGWLVDPLAVDSAFQLAALWLLENVGRAGFPVAIDKAFILGRFEGALSVVCRLHGVDDEAFTGDVALRDARGELVAVFQGVTGRFADVQKTDTAKEVAPVAMEPVAELSDDQWDISKFPEVEALDQRFEMAKLVGIDNPYFHVHAGTAKNTSVIEGVEMLNYSSYNYLGFSGRDDVVQAAQDAISTYGTSVSASRIASGERALHRELEVGIAEHVGVEDSIVFVSGHATNVTTVGHMLGREDLVLHDSLIHDSILQGIYLSGAKRRPFPHNDLDALDAALTQVRGQFRRVMITVEGIYSMDGDICDLPRLVEIKKRHKCLLLVDEAHSAGVLGESGRGIAHYGEGIDPNDVDLWMGTLSKSYASCGGYIAGSAALVRYLKYTAPGFVYSAGITPPNAAAALKSLQLMKSEPEVVQRLRDRSKFFLDALKKRDIDTGDAIGAAVVPAIVGNSLVCMKLSAHLAERKINVQPIVYPAVEDSASRLRFFISALHTEEQLELTAQILAEELARTRAEVENG